jgi:hypothetical protein
MLGGDWTSRQGATPAATDPQRKWHRRGADLPARRPYLLRMEYRAPITVHRDLTAFSVREGRLAPVTCVACGCRLERRDDDTWWHFSGRGDRDARGCIVACAEQPHYGGVAAALG